MRKLAAVAVAAAAGATVSRRVFAPGTHARRLLRKGASRGAQQLRYASGRLKGVEYRISGGHPDPDVGDTVLADRVRSQLGSLERRLDVPHVHVMANDHVVTLHGDVGSEDDAKALEAAVLDVTGVRGVQSFLHVGLIAGDSRPSEGRAAAPPSAQCERLIAAATNASAGGEMARAAVRAVLSTLADRLPEDDREHLFGHLPADVLALMRPPRRWGRATDIRTAEEFVDAVTRTGAVDAVHAPVIVESVLGALRQLVPEEAADIAAVLPASMKDLWEAAVPQ